MIDYDIVNRDFKAFIESNARTYGRTPEYIAQTPTAKEYWAYLIEREKDKIRDDEERH